MSTNEAINRARDAGVDLVEVSPMERPPVCRIMDYGKHKYESKKRQKAAHAGHTVSLKEIRVRPKTDTHDLQLKIKHAEEFLGEGHKVQFTMLFKGRERFLQEVARDVFQGIINALGDKIKVERAPSMEGRRMTILVSPTKAAIKPAAPKPTAAAAQDGKKKPKPPAEPAPATAPADRGGAATTAAPDA